MSEYLPTVERLTVSLAAPASEAMHRAVIMTGDSATDVVNRALVFYERQCRTELSTTTPEGENR